MPISVHLVSSSDPFSGLKKGRGAQRGRGDVEGVGRVLSEALTQRWAGFGRPILVLGSLGLALVSGERVPGIRGLYGRCGAALSCHPSLGPGVLGESFCPEQA